MYASADPTEEVPTLDTRFTMVSPIQILLILSIIAYAWNVRKMNAPVIMTLAVALGLLHTYEHMYRIDRSPEKFRYF